MLHTLTRTPEGGFALDGEVIAPTPTADPPTAAAAAPELVNADSEPSASASQPRFTNPSLPPEPTVSQEANSASPQAAATPVIPSAKFPAPPTASASPRRARRPSRQRTRLKPPASPQQVNDAEIAIIAPRDLTMETRLGRLEEAVSRLGAGQRRIEQEQARYQRELPARARAAANVIAQEIAADTALALLR